MMTGHFRDVFCLFSLPLASADSAQPNTISNLTLVIDICRSSGYRSYSTFLEQILLFSMMTTLSDYINHYCEATPGTF